MRDEIAAYLYKCFGRWTESSYYDLSKVNQAGWLEYADDIIKSMKNLGYRQIPELTVLETNPYYQQDTDGDWYNEYPEFEIYQAGKEAQLAHTIKELEAHISQLE